MSNFEIVKETTDYIVVNKTAGLISEKSQWEDLTVEDQVQAHLVKTKVKPFIGVIHRLDRVTSGVLVFAKKKSVLKTFNQLFSDRKVQKTYLAIVRNKPKKDKGELRNHLVKNQLDKRADIVKKKTSDSQEAVLSYQLIGTSKKGYLLEITPKTGRFHQIRAQLAHIGCPIIGDEKYGSDHNYYPLSICLHAWKLTYYDYPSKKMKTFEADLPKNDYWKFEEIQPA